MTRSEMRAERTRWRRGDAVVAIGAILLGLILAGIFFSIRDLQQELVVANGARDALAQQVQDLGATPVGGKPGSRGDIGPSGPSGPPGPTGSPGPAGPTGKTGAAGSTGKTGVTGVSVTGSPGRDGSDGSDGSSGVAGPAGPQGDPGPAGAQGEQGPEGPVGPQGDPGPACPDGYSLQTPSWDADALVCRRDNAPDPSPSPTDSSLMGLLAMDPLRRKYL